MKIMKIKLHKTRPSAIIPKPSTDGAAAYDIYAPCSFVVGASSDGQSWREAIPTGISIELPYDMLADIRPRSGYSRNGFPDAYGKRHDADVLLGTIDSDYRGEIHVIISNRDPEEIQIKRGQRIAQLLIHKRIPVQFDITDGPLSQTDRGIGGFGSTGV